MKSQFSIICLLLVVLSACSSPKSKNLEIPGTVLSWDEAGGGHDFEETIIVARDDYVISKDNSMTDDADPGSYSVTFSGLFIVSCANASKVSMIDRQSLKALRNGDEESTRVQDPDSSDSAKFERGEIIQLSVLGAERDVQIILEDDKFHIYLDTRTGELLGWKMEEITTLESIKTGEALSDTQTDKAVETCGIEPFKRS